MVKVTLELDYPNWQTAMESNPKISDLISCDECISFSRKEELPDVKAFVTKRNEKIQELYKQMNINPDNASKEIKKSIELVANDWAHDNYYYHYVPSKEKD